MNKLFLAVVIALGGCATQVYHPERDQAAMQKDIAACTESSILSSALNVAVKEDIMACLADMGYRKGAGATAAAGGSALTPAAANPSPPKPAKPAASKATPKPAEGPAPCAVPCKGGKTR